MNAWNTRVQYNSSLVSHPHITHSIQVSQWNNTTIRCKVGDVSAKKNVSSDQLKDAIDERLHLTHCIWELWGVVVRLIENCLEGKRDLHAAPEYEHDARRDRGTAGRGAWVAHKALQTLARLAALYVLAIGVRPARAGYVWRGLCHLRNWEHAERLVLEAGKSAHLIKALIGIANAVVRVLWLYVFFSWNARGLPARTGPIEAHVVFWEANVKRGWWECHSMQCKELSAVLLYMYYCNRTGHCESEVGAVETLSKKGHLLAARVAHGANSRTDARCQLRNDCIDVVSNRGWEIVRIERSRVVHYDAAFPAIATTLRLIVSETENIETSNLNFTSKPISFDGNGALHVAIHSARERLDHRRRLRDSCLIDGARRVVEPSLPRHREA